MALCILVWTFSRCLFSKQTGVCLIVVHSRLIHELLCVFPRMHVR